MELKLRASRDATIQPLPNGWRLRIPSGSSGRYRLAQLDDQLDIPRSNYPWHPPLNFSLRARTSSNFTPGTWGFGLWNDPFGFSLGLGDPFFRLPALPNAIWFFYASQNNYLSLRDDKPAQGFLTQAFLSPRFHPDLILASLLFPFKPKSVRRILSRVIAEDATKLDLDVTRWHRYNLEWSQTSSSFWVDDHLVFRSPVSPKPPLGIVIWIDNQFAAFLPNGKLKWGVEESPKSEWLDVEHIEIK